MFQFGILSGDLFYHGFLPTMLCFGGFSPWFCVVCEGIIFEQKLDLYVKIMILELREEV